MNKMKYDMNSELAKTFACESQPLILQFNLDQVFFYRYPCRCTPSPQPHKTQSWRWMVRIYCSACHTIFRVKNELKYFNFHPSRLADGSVWCVNFQRINLKAFLSLVFQLHISLNAPYFVLLYRIYIYARLGRRWTNRVTWPFYICTGYSMWSLIAVCLYIFYNGISVISSYSIKFIN